MDGTLSSRGQLDGALSVSEGIGGTVSTKGVITGVLPACLDDNNEVGTAHVGFAKVRN